VTRVVGFVVLVLSFYTPYERVFAILVTGPFAGSGAVTWFLCMVHGRCIARMFGQNNFPMVTFSASPSRKCHVNTKNATMRRDKP
jgi:hypothetical protein